MLATCYMINIISNLIRNIQISTSNNCNIQLKPVTEELDIHSNRFLGKCRVDTATYDIYEH